MWRLKQFMPKDQAGLEGKSVEVGSLKLQVRSVIAEGGFSSVYLARDAQTGRSYALKHIICNDNESLDLVRKEVSVMKSLRGHPNVVTLHAHSVFDNGRTKECYLVMDFCEKTLVSVLDARGAGYFDEKQLLLIFRDICNAVFAMHSLSPPIAHRDLKAENVLLGSNGSWKLCDFGSTSTNHKRFERTEEMGLEEDIIRKHTTPAYRAPEMWDLYRRELISEKVDIWALGCLLYRMAYLKSAFDGESKLQILNGNYRIPDLPGYSDCVVNLIKDMLTANPDARPDITQVWRRINEGLPSECRKASPDRAPPSADSSEPKAPAKPAVPSRAPPPPPPSQSVKGAGSFWSTQYAAEAKYDGDTNSSRSNNTQSNSTPETASTWSADFDTANKSPPEVSSGDSRNHYRKGGVANFVRRVQGWNKDESEGNGYTVMSSAEMEQGSEPPRPVHDEISSKVPEVSNDGAFNAFVAEFDNSMSRQANSKREDASPTVHADVEKLKVQLQQALAEKMEFAGKYEKLTAICRSQRQEIQELKSVLAAATSNKEPVAKPPAAQSRRTRPEWHSSAEQAKEKQNGSIWDLQGGLSSAGNPKSSQSSHTVDSQTWQAFGETLASKMPTSKPSGDAPDVRRRQQQHSRAASVSSGDAWGFIQESMNNQQDAKISSGSGPGSSSFRGTPSTDSLRTARAQKPPAGWAGF